MTDIDAILAEKGSFVKNAVNVLYLMKRLGGITRCRFYEFVMGRRWEMYSGVMWGEQTKV